ncbi:hypothetical protein J3B02_003291, partial [Coemansia erecta]
MATKFKYSLESLEWDEQHLRNKDGTYCYCGLDYSEDDAMLKCESCSQLFHWKEYERDTLSWVQVVYLVLYHLVRTEPDKKYFRWRENICATISNNWEGLMPGKAKTATWHNTVAGCLSTHQSIFRSGFDDTQQPGNWTLQDIVPPAQAKFKAAVKSREPRSAKTKAKTKSEAKRPRKKVEVAAGSEAEKEILEVLNERSGDTNRATRPRVSFSDDESETEEHGTKRKAKRRRGESKALENDADLLQSFEIFTRLEKERLGDKADGAPGLDDFDDIESLSSLSSLSSDSELDFADAPARAGLDNGAAKKELASNTALLLPEATETRSVSISFKMGNSNQAESADEPAKHAFSNSNISNSSQKNKIEDRYNNASAAAEKDNSGRDKGINSSEPVSHSFSKAGSQARSLEPSALASASAPASVSTPVLTSVNDKVPVLQPEPVSEPEPLPGPPVWTRMEGVEPRPLFDQIALPNSTSKLQLMSEQSQWEVCAKISSSRVPLTSAARRFRRRLELRRFKRMLGLPLLDVDQRVKECMSRQQMPWPERPIDRQAFELAGGKYGPDTAAAADGNGSSVALSDVNASSQVVDGSKCSDAYTSARSIDAGAGAGKADVAERKGTVQREIKQTAYANSFASRLHGRAFMRDSLTTPVAKVSPFHGRLLRPYIWRDFGVLANKSNRIISISISGKQGQLSEDDPEAAEAAEAERGDGRGPAMLRVQRAIRAHDHPVFRKLGIFPARIAESESIDYVYFQKEHVSQVNALL